MILNDNSIQGSLPLAPICRIKLSFRPFELYGKSLNFLSKSKLFVQKFKELFLEIIVSTFVTPSIIISIEIIRKRTIKTISFLNTATNPIKISKTLNYCNLESSHFLSIKLRSLEARIPPL